jgi:hypothetical protein
MPRGGAGLGSDTSGNDLSWADTRGVVDIVRFGPDSPRRRPSRRLIVVGVVALSAAVFGVTGVFAFGDHGAPGLVPPAVASPTVPIREAAGPPCQPVGWAQSPAVGGAPAGLVLDRASADHPSGLERCDRTAVDGPWTVVVRRFDGSLGRHGAVVTFPASAPAHARSVDVGGAIGKAERGAVTWPVAGAHARIRGDLTEAELIAIAARATFVNGRPAVHLSVGYTVVSTGPYRAPTIHEARYSSAALAEQASLGNGLTYTGVTSGGGFEDQLYAVHTDNGGLVNGRPAIVSSVFGGNETIAWEPTPGIVAYIGYSGTPMNGEAITALQRLAAQARPLTSAQWQAINPQTIDQTNEPG